jgi:ketosteroid isomerase-like protein
MEMATDQGDHMVGNIVDRACAGAAFGAAVVVLGLGAALSSHAAEREPIAASSSQRQQVKSAIEAFRSAVNSSDSAAFFGLLAPDLEVFAPGADPVRGAAAREAFRPWFTELRVEMAPFADEEITVAGGIAIQRHTFRLTTTPRTGGPSTTVRGSGLHVWRRSPSGGWQVIKDIWTVPSESAGGGAP